MRKNIIIKLLFLIIISGCVKEPLSRLGGGYRIDFNNRGGTVLLLDSVNHVLIEDRVMDAVADSLFIIVLQKPWARITADIEKKENLNLGDRQEAFKKSNLHQYWIINKHEEQIFNEKTLKYSNVYGPFTKEEYLLQRKRLLVPDSLVLSNE